MQWQDIELLINLVVYANIVKGHLHFNQTCTITEMVGYHGREASSGLS